jgi:hypothetical protein
MNLSATIDILDSMQNRICKIESVFEQRRSKSAFLNTQVESVNNNSPTDSNKVIIHPEVLAQMVSNTINDNIKVYIKTGKLEEDEYPITDLKLEMKLTDIIIKVLNDNLASEMKKEFGSKLKNCFVSIFPKEDWARGDRRTHKYVGMIWGIMKTLDLWK